MPNLLALHHSNLLTFDVELRKLFLGLDYEAYGNCI